MRWLDAAVCAAMLIAVSTVDLRAQVNATGSFSGQVTDPSGAPIAGAQVKVTQQETGVSVTKQTAQDGNYTVPLLKAGTYTIEVTAPGFNSEVRKDIVLQIQQVGQEDFKLQVGDVKQQ